MSTNTQILHRIKVLEEKLNESFNKLGKLAGLGNATTTGWTDNQIEKISPVVEKFLKHWEIDPEWWKTGEGEVFLTSVHEDADIEEKPKGKNFEEVIDGLIADLRENNNFLQRQFNEIRETNERLRADLRAANDNAIKLATIALTEGKKQ